MSNYPVGRRPRSADPHSTLRLAALTTVAAGVVLLAAAAFVLSYPGIHAVALQAGVSPDLAKLYPVIFDAMMVVAGAAALALRGAGLWSRFYAWACLILLLVAVAIGDAVHATGTALPERATRAAVAITPWVLLLLAFGLLLTMLSHFRKARATVAARQEARAAVAGDAGNGARPAEANGTAPGRVPMSWATPGVAGNAPGVAGNAAGVAGAAAATAGTAVAVEARPPTPPRFGLDFWLGPRASSAPAIASPHDADVADIGDDASHGDPVSYGEETGYVHPDSYRDEGEYSPHGDSGGPGMDTGSEYLGQDTPTGDGEPAPQQGTAADNGEGERPADAAPQASETDTAPQTSQVDATVQASEADTAPQASQVNATAQAGEPDAAAQTGEPDAQASEPDAPLAANEAEAAAQTGEPDAQASEPETAAQASEPDAPLAANEAEAAAQTGEPDAQASEPETAAQASEPDVPAAANEAEAAAQAGEAGQESPVNAAANGGPAGEDAKDDASGEPVAAQSPGLMRLRSTPTRPEE